MCVSLCGVCVYVYSVCICTDQQLKQLYARVCPTILALLIKVRLRKNDLKIMFGYYKDEGHEMFEHPQSLLD